MQHITAALGIHRIVFTKVRRPMGHGKIEALNRLIRSSFIAELKASSITTLDALNEAFVAWMDWYNKRVHTETGEAPLERWRGGADRIRYADEADLHDAFIWKETRTPDKAGVFSLLGTRYQVGPKLARRRVEVRFDPEALHELEVWHEGSFAERVRPLDIGPHRRPAAEPPPPPEPEMPGVDWLGHLTAKRRREGQPEPSPRAHVATRRLDRARADAAVLELLRARLDDGIAEPEAVNDWLARFGPLDPDAAATCLDTLLAGDSRTDRHVTHYLDAIRAHLEGGAS